MQLLKIFHKLTLYVLLTRINKPIGIYLLLWPTLFALNIANQIKNQGQLIIDNTFLFLILIFIIGSILMRSAGCVINDLFDMKYDFHVSRTRNRPLVNAQNKKRISVTEAIIVLLILLTLSALLLLALPISATYIAFVALINALTYPLAKRYTHFPQAILGMAFSWSIPIAFVSIGISITNLNLWLLFVASLLWALIYDSFYARVDLEDDLKIGIKSIAVYYQDKLLKFISLIQILMLSLLLFLGMNNNLNSYYFIALAIVAILMLSHNFRAYKSNCQKNLYQNNLSPQIYLKIFLENHRLYFILWISSFMAQPLVINL